MTIFIEVLKTLIGDQLIILSSHLNTKTLTNSITNSINSKFYNRPLSLEQKKLIEALYLKIMGYSDTNGDAADAAFLCAEVQSCLQKIQIVRAQQPQSKYSITKKMLYGGTTDAEEGNTIPALRKIISHTNEYLEKLRLISFKLLDKDHNTHKPEGIVHFHAACYFGDDLFQPTSKSNPEVRIKKEAALCHRLEMLSLLIKSSDNFEDQRRYTLSVLQDLLSDNERIIRDASTSYSLPVSFWGIQANAPAELCGPSLGRFQEQFEKAVKDVTAMKEEHVARAAGGVISQPLSATTRSLSAATASARSLYALLSASDSIPDAASAAAADADAESDCDSQSELTSTP
ncbi:MAG: hypothetical protein ACHP65_06135 [Legionellales bacterium]